MQIIFKILIHLLFKGFIPAKHKGSRKKYFPPPDLPPDFDPNIVQKKTRFDLEKIGNVDTIKRKHILTSADRAAILGEPLPHR